MTDKTDIGQVDDNEKRHTDRELRKSYLAGAYEQMLVLSESGYFTISVIPEVLAHLDRLHSALENLGAKFEPMPKTTPKGIQIHYGPGLDV